MKFSTDGFENPHLIQPALERIYKAAAKRGFSPAGLKSFKDKLKRAFEKGVADPDLALVSLERLFVEGEADLKWLLEGNRLETTLKFFGYCEFLSQQALKNPDLIKITLEKIEQRAPGRESIFNALEEKLSAADSFEELSAQLRACKNEQYLRLALANFSVPDRLEHEMLELSWLAEASLDLGLKYLAGLEKRKKIEDSRGLDPAKICVLGMGKLGSRELNFSSDIDLVYLCPNLKEQPDPTGFDPQPRKYVALAEQLTKLISQITELGFIFRIDLRLRPGGEGGPLVNPYDAALDYYLNFGRSWERAAFLRSRPVAGDIALGKKFMAELEPFVFRRLHDFASFEDLKELKTRIDLEARKESGQAEMAGYDLKLGPGGIREVEFFVQALQLIYGGKYPELRIPGTMEALEKLNRLGLVKDQETQSLRDAWRLLRKLEHRIQLKNLRQDHRIPKNKRAREVLARSFGSAGKEGPGKFYGEMNRILNQVAQIFAGLFGEETAAEASKYRKLLALSAGPEELEPEFERMGFEEPDLAADTWLRIIAPLQRAERAPKLLAETLPTLLEEIAAGSEPDLALRQMERFLFKTGASAAYLSLLKDHPQVRKLLIELFSESEFLGNLLIAYPELLDEMVSPHALAERTQAELKTELEKYLRSARDYEEKLGQFRLFQKMELLRIGLEELSRGLEVQELEERLTSLADIILDQAYRLSWEESVKQYGNPGKDGPDEAAGLLILGLGRLGSREMSWASDLDLIFIYQGQGQTRGERTVDVHEFFVRLSQKIISTLQTQTSRGCLYKIDTRLRPSGTQGPLVVNMDAFENYHRTEAQVWEKQSLIKARVLVGVAGMRDLAMKKIEQSIYSGSQPEHLKQGMKTLLGRVRSELARETENLYDIKFGCGGEMELEYILQYLQLVNAESHPELKVGNSWLALDRLKRLKIITEPEHRKLKDALWIYRKLLSKMRIYRDRPEHQIRLEAKILDRLAKKIGLEQTDSGDKLLKKVKNARENVRKIFGKYIGS